MKSKLPLTQWLEQQEALAARHAPPPPRGFELLEMIRPWWEKWPERFRLLVVPLSSMEVHYGHAASGEGSKRDGYPVPTLIVRTQAEDRAHARILYFSVSDGQLRLRLQLGVDAANMPAEADITFVDAATARPLFLAALTPVSGGHFRIEADLSLELAKAWSGLKVTDRMPFHLIVHPSGS